MKLATAILTAALTCLAVSPAQAQRWYRPSQAQRWYVPGERFYSRNYQPIFQPSAQSSYYVPSPTPGYGNRRLWVYNQGDPWTQGAFQQMGPGFWVESNPQGSWRYQETDRNPAYVELFDPDRGLIVRLFNDHMVQRSQWQIGNWLPGYRGHWQ
jgi:hypothetical protein